MLVLCLMPVSCGALTNLFSAMSGEYKVSEGTVQLVNGLGMGVAGALGSLLGGWLSDRINRKLNYALMGAATGLCALAMAAAPMTETTYIWGISRLQLRQRRRASRPSRAWCWRW